MKEVSYVVVRGTTVVFKGTIDECFQECTRLDEQGVWDMEVMSEEDYHIGIVEMKAIGML